MWKLTIYCCYHDISQKINDDPLTKRFYGPDWLLNPYLSEFSMFYDIRKNDKDSDYIGTCHYRRRIYSSDFDEGLVNENSCQVYEIVKGNKFCGKFWIKAWFSDKWWCCEWLRIDYYNYINGKYWNNNVYIKTDNIVWKKKYRMISRSSFILTRNCFMNLCDYIFGFLDYLDKKYLLGYRESLYDEWIMNKYVKCNNKLPFELQNNEWHMKRLLAYLFERMASIYLEANVENIHLIHPQLMYVYPWTWKKLR